MKRPGMRVLDFRTPALVDGFLTYLDGARYEDRIVALCFLPYAGHISGAVLNDHARRFSGVNTELCIVASGARPLHRLWMGNQDKPLMPILADPCGRLHRLFGVAVAEPVQRCHTFVIDRDGILRLRVSHDFVETDLKVLQELIGASQLRAAHDGLDDVEGVGLIGSRVS